LSSLLFSISSISSRFPWPHPFLLIYVCCFSSYISYVIFLLLNKKFSLSSWFPFVTSVLFSFICCRWSNPGSWLIFLVVTSLRLN
jgi:hypothetical protein